MRKFITLRTVPVFISGLAEQEMKESAEEQGLPTLMLFHIDRILSAKSVMVWSGVPARAQNGSLLTYDYTGQGDPDFFESHAIDKDTYELSALLG